MHGKHKNNEIVQLESGLKNPTKELTYLSKEEY